MTYARLQEQSSSRLWGLAFAIALHAAFLYVLMLTSGTSVFVTPADIQVRFIPPPPRDEPVPEPIPPQEHVPPSVDIQKPVLNIATSRPEPHPVDDDNAVDDIVEIPRQTTMINLETGSGYTSKPQPFSMKHGLDHYPKESIRAQESGRTMLRICISASGTVESVTVARSSGFPRLDKAAVQIGKDYRFKPALLKGKPVAACVEYGILFSFGNLHPQQETAEPESQTATVLPPTTAPPTMPSATTNPDIGPLKAPVPIRVYLKVLAQYGVTCNTTQLRVIGQDIHDGRYVIEAQCREQPNGLVVFLPVSDNAGKFEMLDCNSAAKRQIQCEFATRQ